MTGRTDRVLLFATTTGYQIRSFGEAAEACGVRLVFASDRCDQLEDPWWDHAIPVRFEDDARSESAVVEALGTSPPHGVLAVGDRPTVLAARVAARYGLDGNPPAAAAASRNKLQARTAVRAAGLLTPSYTAVSMGADPRTIAAQTRYPAVIKPLALSGSRGVMRVNDPRAFVDAFERLRALLQAPDVRLEREAPHDEALVEAFIPGQEFAIEGVLTRGRFTALAIFDKPDPLDGPFFEETIYVTPSRASAAVQHAILDAVATAARALGLHHGPVHAECRVNEQGVYVIEVAARPIGGLCSKALRFRSAGGGDASLEEVLLRHALGQDVTPYAREAQASGVMMIPIPRRGIYRGVEGEEDARRVPHVHDVRITTKRDARLVPLPEGRSYLGFIFARADDPATVDAALRDAHARLRFAIDTDLPVI